MNINDNDISAVVIQGNVINFIYAEHDDYIYNEIINYISHESLINDNSLTKHKDNKIQVTEIEHNDLNDDLSCCVCLESLDTDQKIAKLDCNHIFHIKCIREWGYYKTVCPICRIPINVIDNNVTT